VTQDLQSLSDVLTGADRTLRAGLSAAPRVWPTGFAALDTYVGGGLRAGELTLLGGPQGLGKTTFVLQAIRNIAAAGGTAIYFSFEHEEEMLLERLLSMEAAIAAGMDAMSIGALHKAMAADPSAASLSERLSKLVGGPQALAGVQDWGQRVLLRRCGASTTMQDIAAAVESVTTDRPVVVVDYLQKIAGSTPGVEDERVTGVVQELKDLALRCELPVLSIVAADKEGIAEGRRLRIQHLRGSTALAYEADVVLIMNDKFDVVARHHLVYNVGNAERFRDWVVLTIEKNRSGLDRIDLEFEKRFTQGRFEPAGRVVNEQLVDERVFVE
jgi:replicative DNA helicase